MRSARSRRDIAAAVAARLSGSRGATATGEVNTVCPNGPWLPASLAMAVAWGGALGFGVLDDLRGSGKRRGLRGHLGALAHGEVTTGAVKLAGLAATGLGAACWTAASWPTSPSTPGSSPAAPTCSTSSTCAPGAPSRSRR